MTHTIQDKVNNQTREDAGCWLGPGSGLPHGWLAFTAPVFLLPGHHTPHSAWAPSGHTGESLQ